MIDLLAQSGFKVAEPIIAICIQAFIFGVIIVSLIRLVRNLSSSKNEQKLIRMELGKLANEVHLIREDLKGKNPSETD